MKSTWAINAKQESDKRCYSRFFKKPTLSIPGTCNDWEETSATYRFLAHAKIEWADMWAPRQRRTRTQLAEQAVVLNEESATELDFNGQKIDFICHVVGGAWRETMRGDIVRTDSSPPWCAWLCEDAVCRWAENSFDPEVAQKAQLTIWRHSYSLATQRWRPASGHPVCAPTNRDGERSDYLPAPSHTTAKEPSRHQAVRQVEVTQDAARLVGRIGQSVTSY